MEEKRGDNDEEKKENERLTIHYNRSYARRPLSSLTNENRSPDRRKRPIVLSAFDDAYRQKSAHRRSEGLSNQMKALSLHHISNPSLIEQDLSTKGQSPLINDEDDEINNGTYSFRREFHKLRTAKSQGELYQPPFPLTLPPMSTPIVQENNDTDYRLRNSCESPSSLTISKSRAQKAAIPTVSTMNVVDEPSTTAPSQKLPIWKRLKKIIIPSKRNKEHSHHQRKQASTKVAALQLNGISSETNRTTPDGMNNIVSSPMQNPMRINELKAWITSKSFPEQKIRDEYEKLPTESLHPKTAALRSENRSKNRFTSIEPYDHSRVILQRLPTDPFSDYINASYIDSYRENRVYIAAQAPTETTIYDFMRMIWQQRIQWIIMVTRLFEDGKHKCLQYWPDEGEKRVNDIRIRLDSEEKFSDYTIRRLTLFNQNEPTETLTVKQYHFLSWPDHGCLSLPTPLLDYRQRFRADYKLSNINTSPILVHCSAGVGRSGTFIALDALLNAAEYQETIDVLEFTHRMRQNRVYMIQTVEQYVFLYRSLIEGILLLGSTITIQEFINTRKFPMDIKNQYKLLENLQSTIELTYREAQNPNNMNKNRFESILAPDSNRPYLMTQVDKGTDYINAVFVHSYRQNPCYILTQYPLAHTCVDFWRLAYDHNVLIIMLLETIPRDPKNVPYWNQTIGQVSNFGPFEVTLMSQKEDEYLIERVFDLKLVQKPSYNNERNRTIRQFQVKENIDRLCIVKRFLKEMRTYNGNNVILQCLNGATCSGYFAALCNSVDKMITEHVVDPFKAVRLLRAIRPQIIDQNQYESLFCSMFDYVQKYMNSASSMRQTENSTHQTTSNGKDQSSIETRVLQRL